MPVCVGVAVDEVRGIALTAFLAGGFDYDHRYVLDAWESHRHFHLGHVFVPRRDGASCTEIACAFVGFCFFLTYGIHDGRTFTCTADCHVALAVTADDGCLVARRGHGGVRGEVGAVGRAEKEAHDVRHGFHVVFRQGRTLSAAVAAEAGHCRVKVDVRRVALRQLVGMRGQHQFERAPRQDGGGQTSGGHELDAVARSVGQGGPAHFLAVGHVLRFAVVDELVFHSAFVAFNELACLSVVVVVERSAAVVGVAAVFRVDLEGVADAGKVEFGIVGSDGRREFDASVGIDGPCDLRVELEVVRAGGLVLMFGEFVGAGCRTAADGRLVGSLRLDVERNDYGAVLACVAVGGQRAVSHVVQAVLYPRVPGPVVVVDLRPVGVELRAVAVGDDFVRAVGEVIDRAGILVEACGELVALDGDEVLLVGHAELAALGHRGDGGPSGGFLHEQLFLHLDIAFLCPRHVLAQAELHFDEVLRLGLERGVVVRNGVAERVAGAELHARSAEGVAAVDGKAVLEERPRHLVVAVDGDEVVFVGHAYLSLRHVDGQDVHVLVNLLHLVVLGLRRKVGVHQAVHAEDAVVWFVAEVAAIGDEATARGLVVVVEAVVNPLPDGAAADVVGRLDSIPIINQVADGVAHRVRVF